ncbi:MAG: CRISPR-associated endonuclease Cas1 [Rickettsiales bacterium]|jgi:CRISPR-associated protein Cas1|nr:CRISPR-associated endonuclease Cas1 [Rickettsiales bacterium]
MSILYLTETASVAKLEKDSIIVCLKDQVLSRCPLETLESVVLIGVTHLSTQLTTELLKRDIPVLYLSHYGKFFGRLEPTTHINIERQREQFRMADDKNFCIGLTKTFIIGKVKNCAVLLRRYNRNIDDKEIELSIETFKEYIIKIENAESIEEILGYEGNVAKIYFKCIGGKIVDKEFYFEKRTRQPPEDKFNALISFGYTLLLYEIYVAIESRGLHPYCSFLHQIRAGHPALASDLIEEFRPSIIDSLMLGIVNNHIIRSEHFEYRDDGIFLTRDGLKIVITKFEERMKEKNSYINEIDYKMSFRDILNHQAMKIVNAITNKDYNLYETIKIR